MNDYPTFSLTHISDLHFSEGTDQSNPNHTHSIPHLQGIEKALSQTDTLDLLIISGDISNSGDRQSLITASGWIFRAIPIGNNEFTGLQMHVDKTGIIPGNHDAWNAKSSGSLLEKRQKSLENYNYAFSAHQIDSETGCYYKWIEKNGHGLYLAFVDSCFLGDTEKNEYDTFGNCRFDQAIAKGKLSTSQTENLLEWHDRGVNGTLDNPNCPGEVIDRTLFAKSLKIIVMHHYLFEPPGHSSDYFMRLQHRDIVFRNVALSDFDVMLCGHKHIPSFDVHTYGHHFDGRATNRYLVNYFRRLIGLHSYPIQFKDSNGKLLTKCLSIFVQILAKLTKKQKQSSDSSAIAEEVFALLKDGLDDPGSLERKIKSFLNSFGIIGAEMLEPHELKEIQKRISVRLSQQERNELKKVASRVVGMSRKLKSRPFLQVMSGSSAKLCLNKTRYLNAYKIMPDAGGWKFTSMRFECDTDCASFSDEPFLQHHYFGSKLNA